MKVRTVVLASVLLGALALPLSAGNAQETPLNQWEMLPGTDMRELVKDGATIVSTSALVWPDGISALTTLLTKADDVWRCIDWYDVNFRANGFMCYRLVGSR